MRTRLATVATLTLAGLTAACGAASPDAVTSPEPAVSGPAGQPPVVHLTDLALDLAGPTHVDVEVAHAEPAEAIDQTPGEGDGRDEEVAASDDPVEAAAATLVELLAAEGLAVTSIDTHLERDEGDQVEVRVDVAHSPGHGHPVQSRYLLELVRDAGRWRVVRLSEPA